MTSTLSKFGRNLSRAMSTSTAILQRMELRAQEADDLIVKLKNRLDHLKATAAAQQEQELKLENEQLREQVNNLKSRLNFLENRNGYIQFAVPPQAVEKPPTPAVVAPEPTQKTEAPKESEQKQAPKKEKKEKKEKKGDGGAPKAAAGPVDISLVDLRVGIIREVQKHPDADSLYVEQIDCGEAQPRTVVSGLVQHIPIEQMQNKVVVICCNLKPAKMRGILSQAMVMCACTSEKVEILDPPAGSAPGDRVTVEGYPLPDDFPPQMNPKKKIFEQVKPDLSTNAEGVATYKGAVWKIEGKGTVTAPSLTKSEIR